MSFEEIAKIMGVTEARAVQIHSGAIRKIKYNLHKSHSTKEFKEILLDAIAASDKKEYSL